MAALVGKRGLLAGILIALGALFSLSVAPYGTVAQGTCFSTGLFAVLCCGAFLFTGGILIVHDVWNHELEAGAAASFLALVWALNLVGAAAVAVLAWACGFDAGEVARAKAAMPWGEALVRAVLCNFLVCLAVWTAKDCATAHDILCCVVPPVACFVCCGYDHCVADMLYMPLGLLNGAVSPADALRVIAVATVGNVLGGLVFSRLVWAEGARDDA